MITDYELLLNAQKAANDHYLFITGANKDGVKQALLLEAMNLAVNNLSLGARFVYFTT